MKPPPCVFTAVKRLTRKAHRCQSFVDNPVVARRAFRHALRYLEERMMLSILKFRRQFVSQHEEGRNRTSVNDRLECFLDGRFPRKGDYCDEPLGASLLWPWLFARGQEYPSISIDFQEPGASLLFSMQRWSRCCRLGFFCVTVRTRCFVVR